MFTYFKFLLPFIIFLPAHYGIFNAGKPMFYKFYKADNVNFRYVGRVDFSDPLRPRFWMPGVYIRARFKGDYCKIFLGEQLLGFTHGAPHNYVEIVIDDQKPFRLLVDESIDTIDISARLHKGIHSLLICKDTEAGLGLGYMEFLGISCKELLPIEKTPQRKIEFIGNSITCGYGNDAGSSCKAGYWFDHENAYEGYGAITARALHAQWHISAVSGIGLIHSCCNKPVLMPQVFDKMDMQNDSILWDFKRYIPDVVTICLGQNDGIQDSVAFCSAYVDFIKAIRRYYPNAKIICLNSPMADKKLNFVLRNYINGIVAYINSSGDNEVYKLFCDKRLIGGCYGHPSGQEDSEIAYKLISYIRNITDW